MDFYDCIQGAKNALLNLQDEMNPQEMTFDENGEPAGYKPIHEPMPGYEKVLQALNLILELETANPEPEYDGPEILGYQKGCGIIYA